MTDLRVLRLKVRRVVHQVGNFRAASTVLGVCPYTVHSVYHGHHPPKASTIEAMEAGCEQFGTHECLTNTDASVEAVDT